MGPEGSSFHVGFGCMVSLERRKWEGGGIAAELAINLLRERKRKRLVASLGEGGGARSTDGGDDSEIFV